MEGRKNAHSISVEVWVLLGAIMAAGFKGKNKGLQIHYYSKVTQEHLLQRERTSIYSHLNNLFTKGFPLWTSGFTQCLKAQTLRYQGCCFLATVTTQKLSNFPLSPQGLLSDAESTDKIKLMSVDKDAWS